MNKPSEESQCLHCFHYDEEFPGTCPAFYPGKIPGDILTGKSTHEATVEGQTNNIFYTPTEEAQFPSL